MEKKTIYQIVRFFIISFFIIYFLYIKESLPISIILLLEILLLAKTLPITKFIEGKIVKHYPRYQNLNIWVKRLILLVS
jgi:hypothetical protein